MSPESHHEITIVGGGLVGCLLAIYLRRHGVAVRVLEARSDMRASGAAGGRSINLVVTERGLRALDVVGLKQQALELTVPVTGRMIHAEDGSRVFQPYGRDVSECNYSISRAELNVFLMNQAEACGARFEFEQPLAAADLDTGQLTVEGQGGRRTVDADVVIGADGAASAVRRAMVQRPGFEDSAELLAHGYKELLIPADANGGYRIEKHALHIWPRGRVMLMALPNLDGSFTVTLYLPQKGPSGFAELDSGAAIEGFFAREFPSSVALMPDLVGHFRANPTGELGTVRCRPWHVDGRALLIGDAAHAIVPFFGQGMNCGFEDCRILDELLTDRGLDDLAATFRAFDAARKPNADAIADMALENFVEMRDRVGDPAFRLRKEVEHRLESAFPEEYRSRYSMVMYSHIPYATAQAAGRIQEELLAEICRDLETADDLDLSDARRKIGERLTPFLEEHGVSLDY